MNVSRPLLENIVRLSTQCLNLPSRWAGVNSAFCVIHLSIAMWLMGLGSNQLIYLDVSFEVFYPQVKIGEGYLFDFVTNPSGLPRN